ncbi:MAG: cell division ATP-binding protein FtsE, partial [bacterium]
HYILGTTGAGKTTLMRLMYRDYRPTKGQILINNRNIGTMPESDVPDLRRRIGVVFQDFKLLEDRNVFDNVAISLLVRGEDRHEIDRRVMRALDQVGLKDRKDQDPRTLSGGEAQRVSLARALVKEPEILLADEPTGNLDPEFSDNILELLNKINKRGTTLLMATHDYETITKYPHPCLELEDGKLREKEHPAGHATESSFESGNIQYEDSS